MRTLLAKVARDLRRRPLRNLLTLLGVVFGVAGVVAISVTASTLIEAQQETYSNTRQADLATFTSDISPTTRNLVERQPNVTIADTRAITFTRFDSGNSWTNLRLVGIDSFPDMRLDVIELTHGRWPGRGEIAFDESTRELTPVAIGDVVAVQDTPDDPVRYLTVVGLTRSPAQLGAGLLNQASAYVPASTVREITGRTGDNFLMMRVADPDRASQTASDISRLLAKRGASAFGFDIRDPEQFVGSRELGTLLLLLQVFSWMGAILSSVLVANTLAAVMGEETTQIGIIRSLGGQRWQVILTYLAYGGVIGLGGALIGWVLGTILGRAISAYLTNLTGMQLPGLHVRPREILLAFLVGTIVTTAAALIPVVIHASKKVAPLLRSPGIRSDAQSRWLRRLTAPLPRLSSTLAIGVRNALRRPGRAISTVVVVSVAVAAFIGTNALSRSVSGTVDELYDLYGADGWVSYERPVDTAFATVLERDPWIVHVEPWTSASGSFGVVRTDIWGMPEHNPLYAYQLVAGTWVTTSNPPSAVLTSNLAANIDARVGDVRELDVGKKRISVQIVGIVNDSSTYLGSTATGKAFMRVEDVNRLRGTGSRADIFAFKLTSSAPLDVDLALREIEDRTRTYGPVTYATYTDKQSSKQAINVLTLMLNAMVAVVAVVGVAGIANALLISIAERRREFGVLRAIGASARHVIGILVSEGLVLAIFGLCIGVAAGYPLAKVLVAITSRELFALNFYLSAETIAVTFALALLAVAGVSALPGLVASRIRPIQVLRYE